MNSSFLKYGDKICLYSDTVKGFLQTIGFNNPNFIVQKIGDKNLALVPNQRNMVFEIVPKLNYNLQKEFNKTAEERNKLLANGSNDQEALKQLNKKCVILDERKKTEIVANDATILNSQGDPVIYGMNIQLKHLQSGEFLNLSKKSALQDKTCMKLELSDTPTGSRVSFQIQPRYKYRQEGDKVIYSDQILLYNVKSNAYVHFSNTQETQPTRADDLPATFRPKSPYRRRNPENLFPWYESNVSPNYEKWTIVSYRQCEKPDLENFCLHGGDVIRLRHSETGAFITIDDLSKEKNHQQEAYLRIYKGSVNEEAFTTNQLFEIEMSKKTLNDNPEQAMLNSGEGLQWEEDSLNQSMNCSVHLRHFNSGRLLQITFGKEQDKIVHKVTLQDSGSTNIEDDGDGNPTPAQMNSGVLQNFGFNLYSRAIIGEGVRTLSMDSVCNIYNSGAHLYMSTFVQAQEREDDDSDPEENKSSNPGGADGNTVSVSQDNASPSQSEFISDEEEFIREKKAELQQAQEQIYRKIKSDTYLDNIQQYSIIMKTESNMNDVFVPIKATSMEISDVQFCQSAVPKLKQFLFYIREKDQDSLNLPFYISVQELLIKIIKFILKLESSMYQDPFKCEGYPDRQRQKIMRETRLIDLLIDCLAYPFTTELVNYDELTQKHPITRICQLIYRLLKHCAKDYTINKNYIAQWIDLFFKQAMKTNENNSFGAENTISELLADNKQLLDTQIEPSTIVSLVDLCLTQPKHERFLNLLAGICACNGDAIQSNQDNITDVVLGNDHTRTKMLFPMITERGVHYVVVKDNLQEEEVQPQWIDIERLFKIYNDSGDLRLYFYFQSLLSLCASICLQRNYKAIKHLEEQYKLQVVIDCTLNSKLENKIRAQFARLLIHLHMDKDPLEQINVPIMTRVWQNVQEGIVEIPQGKNIPPELLQLKPAMEQFVRDRQGFCRVYETDFNLFMIEALKVIETMISLGFYSNEKELIQIMDPLITLLDGSLDFYDEDEEIEHKKRVQESGYEPALASLVPVYRTKEQNSVRYKKTIQNEAIMKIKLQIVEICSKVMDFQDNTRLTRFLISYNQLDAKGLMNHQRYIQTFIKAQSSSNVKKIQKQLKEMSSTFEEMCLGVNEWITTASNDRTLDLQDIADRDFVCILLDLNLYENPGLVSQAFKLLVRQFTQKQQIVDLGTEVQLLEDQEEIAVLEQCSECLRQMKNDVEKAEFWVGMSSEDGLRQTRNFIDRLSSLTELCVFKENRVVDMGNKKDEKKRKRQENEDEKFEFLNLSELQDQWDDEDKKVCVDYEIPDESNQRLLRNLRAHDVALQIIKIKCLKSAQNRNAYLKVVERSYIFLIKFVKKNKENQTLILNEIECFLEDIELGVHALELITEIFRDNECLLTFKLTPLIKRIATGIDALDIETTKKATLLSFVSVFMSYKENFLEENQYLCLSEFTSTMRKNSNFLFVNQDGHENLRIYIAEMKQQYFEFMNDEKLLPEIDMPPEISYIIQYINLISYSGSGKNSSSETRAQALFPLKDTIINLRVADFCYPLKSALMFFLQNIWFECEKEISEDFTMSVWQVIEIIVNDLQKFVEVMQRSKRSQGGMTGKSQKKLQNQETIAYSDDESNLLGLSVGADMLNNLTVDVNKNFEFITAFGKFKVSELMLSYVFENILPAMRIFLNLRLAMKEYEKKLVRKLLKLIFLSIAYKTKPIHDKNTQLFVRTIRAIPQLQELGGDIDMSQLGLLQDEESGRDQNVVQLSVAEKLKIYLQTTRRDPVIVSGSNKEFENLVKQIINIKQKTEEKFQGANTIQQADYIRSLIQSTDIVSDIPTKSRTQSLKIIRKVIESENLGVTTSSAAQWDTDDWISYKELIINAQNMLNAMDLIRLICRIIAYEAKREIKEEAFMVGIAVLLGGNINSQLEFAKYIINDVDNHFCKALFDLLNESYEIVKRSMIKRNQKKHKIIQTEKQLLEIGEVIESDNQELFDEMKKLKEQKLVFEDEIKDTEYVQDENRDAEELTVSRALENMTVMLRFIQLLCENHNPILQRILSTQKSADGKAKAKSINLVSQMARMLEQFQKVINNISLNLGHQLVDTIIETIQGPCKENQIALVNAKILDCSREFISNFSNRSGLAYLGFKPPDEDQGLEEEEALLRLDEFISKISTMLLSLLEGEQDVIILDKMDFSLSFEDIKNRILDVYGVFLLNIELYPLEKLQAGEQPEVTMLSALSKRCNFNVLQQVSLNKVNRKFSSSVFEGVVQEAFQLYSLIQCLADGLPNRKQITQRENYSSDQWKVFEFLRSHTARIEVSVLGKLQRVYFPIRPVCHYISEKTKANLMEHIDRDSQQTKVTELLESVPTLIDEMKHNEILTQSTIKITPKLMNDLKDFSTLVGLIISLAQLIFLERVNNYRDAVSPEIVQRVILILGIIQGCSSGILIVFYIINKFALICKAKWRDYVNENRKKLKVLPNEQRLSITELPIEATHLILLCKGPEAEEFNIDPEHLNFGNWFTKVEYDLHNLYFFLQDGTFRYFVLYFGISFLGFYSNELFYCFHLLDVIQRSPILQNVLKSITSNATQLLMTLVLGLIVMYIYATISFFYLQDTVYDYTVLHFDSDWIGENQCTSMFQCFVTVLGQGMYKGGGIGDVTASIHYKDDTQIYLIKLFYDISFFIVIKIIWMNILFGIIVDTFAQLREQKSFILEDKKNKCFICNYDRFTFDKNSEGGFERHIAKDHNLWFYVYYIVHLQSKNTTEYSGIESYVASLYDKGEINWVPRTKALCLDGLEEEDVDDAEVVNLRSEIAGNVVQINQINEKIQHLMQLQARKNRKKDETRKLDPKSLNVSKMQSPRSHK